MSFNERHNSLHAAIALHKQGDLDGAEASYRRFLDNWPDDPDAWNNLGLILRSRCRIEASIEALRNAVRNRSNFHSASYYLAMMLLLDGRFEEGWRLYENRDDLVRFNSKNPDLVRKSWDGSPLKGRTLLLISEQGFGDMIQFSRFIPEVTERAGSVIVDCFPELTGLFQASFPMVKQFVERGAPMPNFDCQVNMMSLGQILSVNEKMVSSTSIPYLTSPSEPIELWANRIAGNDEIQVGIAWQGRSTYFEDHLRSISLAALMPVFKLTGFRFHSLQPDEHARRQIASLPKGIKLADTGAAIRDYSDTAAVVSLLDLVITVDTSVAHLAGALGKPVWIMLPFIPDWRWLLHRNDSPWYPTARLFRQQTPDDWGPVVDSIATALGALRR
ncbi:MAG: glycosyltransferase family protein [Proteobacteria bacterium]|nr:glycosyltransferase family protein [Pseudomonadota bacterium]